MINSSKKIMYLGPGGSYSQIAMEEFKKKLGLNFTPEPINSLARIIQTMDEMDSVTAVLPIENSIEGIVRETVDSLVATKCELKILSQITMPIKHCLISKGNKEDIENIVSIPQALGQCQNYIATNFKKSINVVSANSTSSATSMLDGKDETWASIANEFCANLYSKKILEHNINDVKENQTRFILLSKNIEIKMPKPTRTSLAFSTKNEAGSLLRVLEIFNRNSLNLIYIESRPSKKVFGEYIFFVDIDRGIQDIEEPLKDVRSTCEFYRLLGSYTMI